MKNKTKSKVSDLLDYQIFDMLVQKRSGLSSEEYKKRKEVERKIEDILYGFKTKYQEGFTSSEIDDLLAKHFPSVKRDELNSNIGVVTYTSIDGETIIYGCDIVVALKCTISKRKQTVWECD